MRHTMNGLWVAVAALVALGVATNASAEEKKLLLPIGMSAEVGGGARGFVSSDARDAANIGGQWTARFIFGTRSYVGGEAAYIGTLQTTKALTDTSAQLLSNGVEGLVRVNFMTGAWQPYAVGGVTWRRYSLTNTDLATSSMIENEDVAEIPVGVGIAYRFSGLIVDLRATYNNAFGQMKIANANLSALAAGAKVGFEF